MLKVNEIYGPVVQGEGYSLGQEVLFLRLSGCNLHCIWCDSFQTWNWIGTSFAHPNKVDRSIEEHKMEIKEVYEKLLSLSSSVRRLVVSGGEPMIQQKQLQPLLQWLKQDWFIEVETNGTIRPLPAFVELVGQFNCSPKLSNSGDPLKLRERSQALSDLAGRTNCYFKFVITCDTDVEEILLLISKYQLNPQRIYLMPEGMTKERLNQTRSMTQTLAATHGFQYSPRRHIELYGNQRGV